MSSAAKGNSKRSSQGVRRGGTVATAGSRQARSPNHGRQDDTPQHDTAWLDSRWRSRLRKKLLAWFGENARELPWRSNPQPYHVWVSEIMLQQTQVATVLPYFKRFLTSFPTIADLAGADEPTLMNHWEGLGYYRRARSLHAAAKLIVERHGGEFPRDFDDVLALPGIGRYTAGAILSISDSQRLPVLEGNTQRVFSRWIALRRHPTEKQANDLLWEFAETMLPRATRADSHSGIFNQAAMELGALVCTPKQPDCPNCPVRNQCVANAAGLQNEIPGRITKTKYEDRTEYALIVTRPTKELPSVGKKAGPQTAAPRYLVRPLPDGGRWAGLWDFPRPTHHDFESVESAADWLSEQIGTPVRPGICLSTFKHAVTKYRITLHVHAAQIRRVKKQPSDPWRWLSLSELRGLPMSVTGRKIVEFLSNDAQALLPLE